MGIIIQVPTIFAQILIHTIVCMVQQVYNLCCITFQMNSILTSLFCNSNIDYNCMVFGVMLVSFL